VTPASGHAAVRPARPAARVPARSVPEVRSPGQPPRDRPGGTYARADLGPDPAAAARARRLTRDALARWDMQHLTDDAEAIASEITSNAIKAATRPAATLPAIIFAIHRRPGEVRISVWDNGVGKPEQTEPGPDAEAGRGLAIVDALTGRNWGWWPTPVSGGKVVWAALSTATDDARHDDEHVRAC
jgi:anti-sigma regulatory factor (Ser/Thr protein kinase)